MRKRLKELLENTLLFTIANMGSKILVFLMVPLYTAILSTTDYGISDLVRSTASVMFPLLTCMISEGVLRYCFVKDCDIKNVVSIGVKISLYGTILCCFLSIIFFYIPFFAELGYYIFFIPLYFISQSFMTLLHKIARGVNNVKASAYAGLIDTILIVGLNILSLVVFKTGIMGYMCSFVFADFITIIFLCWKCRITQYISWDVDAKLQKYMLKYSIPLVPNYLSWWLLQSFNQYIVLAQLGAFAVGFYSASTRIPAILTVLSDIFAQAWLLTALKDYDTAESKSFIVKMYNLYWGILIILTSILILLSRPVASILLSGDFFESWSIVPYLFIAVFFGAIVGFQGSIFSAEKKNQTLFVSTLIGSFFSVVVTLIFLKTYGVVAVAVATFIGYFIIWVIREAKIKKYIDFNQNVIIVFIQTILLLIEAYWVVRSQILPSIVCIILLVGINFKSLYSGFCFAKNIINQKLKKNG